MTISGAQMSGFLYTEFSNVGFAGENLLDFCDGTGNGSANTLIGKGFSTVDTGTTPGNGSGSGVGLTIDDVALKGNLYSALVAAFPNNPPAEFDNRLDFCEAIAKATKSIAASITLTSNHTPVFLGTGNINGGSIIIGATLMKLAIYAGTSFTGENWLDLAGVIGDTITDYFEQSATGSVTITGSPTSPTTVPGSGAGSGTMS
jgi:hypothetical protein